MLKISDTAHFRRVLAGLCLVAAPALFAVAEIATPQPSGSAAAPAFAADPGVSDTEIVLGGTHPYSGPASAYGNIGKGIAVYFSYVNDHGGVNDGVEAQFVHEL